MKSILPFLFCLSVFSFNTTLWSQNKKPKIALVLSGGGAKGIAHIPVLQALDSLGIVPDLIIGTSMGSIVGGLYAMGYSGDSIAKIAKTTHWDELLGGTVSLNNVSVEEMGEFNKYLIDIDVKDYKPRIKSSLINDQNLREFLSVLTYPSFQTTKFDELPIPYRAIATDIVNGQLVVMDEGSLGLAMRASMSIPGVFKPVPYKNTLLVDGGLLNNFPTDIAKKMGADFIIGSDVGDEKVSKEQLENLSTLIFQSTMLISNLKNEENRRACDILLNHFPNLTYSTADFNASTTLYNEGKIATKQNLPALVALAQKLRPYSNKKIELLQIDKQFVLDTIVYNNFSSSNLKLVTKRSGIQTGQSYTISNIVEGVRKAIGTNLFNQINSNIYTKDNRTFLELNAFENYRSQLKGSLHFDSFRGFGAILNYTGRNLLGESSRLLITTDIAQQPRIRAQYQKIFGQNKNWWWRTENYNHRLIQNVFIEGKIADNIQYNAIHFNNQINRNINSLKSYLGLGINYHFTHLRPKTDPTFNTIFTLRSYYLNQTELNIHYRFNTIDKVYFASKGSNLYVELSKSLFQKADINFINSSRENFSGSLNGFTKLNFNYEYRKPISDKVLIFQANSGLLFENNRKPNQLSVSEYGYASKYFLGGYTTNPLKNGISFPGIKENELNVSQFIHLNLSLQSNLSQKVYLIPHLDLASVGFSNIKEYGQNFLSPKGNWQSKESSSFLASTGATVSYNSFLGPISFDASWVNNNKLSLFISIGLLFNPS